MNTERVYLLKVDDDHGYNRQRFTQIFTSFVCTIVGTKLSAAYQTSTHLDLCPERLTTSFTFLVWSKSGPSESITHLKVDEESYCTPSK